jgi:hypothetical protein
MIRARASLLFIVADRLDVDEKAGGGGNIMSREPGWMQQ